MIPIMVLDVEATCLSDNAQATEIGWCGVDFDNQGVLQPTTKAFVQRCKPSIPISFGSMAITHIYDDELVNEPPHTSVIPNVVNRDVEYVIGHNINYDLKVIKNAGVDVSNKKVICTLALARALYPDADHKLLALLHQLDYEFARTHAKHAHSAKYDVMFCVRLLRIMSQAAGVNSIQALYDYFDKVSVPTVMSFGKHQGTPIADVPIKYIEYMLTKDIDPYVRIAFERRMQQQGQSLKNNHQPQANTASANNTIPMAYS